MKKYRPEGWLHGGGYQDEINGSLIDNYMTDDYEAGADAMLELLKERGLRLGNSEQLIYALKVGQDDIEDFRYFPHINGFSKMKIEGAGTLVFIPEDEE